MHPDLRLLHEVAESVNKQMSSGSLIIRHSRAGGSPCVVIAPQIGPSL
jgi:hypothetical protein